MGSERLIHLPEVKQQVLDRARYLSSPDQQAGLFLWLRCLQGSLRGLTMYERLSHPLK